MTEAQIRGYLYEIFISEHLERLGFERYTYKSLDKNVKPKDGEVEGRGEFHQIDFAGIYKKLTPYVFPLRVLAECKFYSFPVSKDTIRNYIGVTKDISENYIVPSKLKRNNKRHSYGERYTDIPVIFSASGFNAHAENLAWAHGINLITHQLSLLSELNKAIDNLANYIYDLTKVGTENASYYLSEIRNAKLGLNNIFLTCIKGDSNCSNSPAHCDYFEQLRKSEKLLFILATTSKGSVISLLGDFDFPDTIYEDKNETIVYLSDLENNEFCLDIEDDLGKLYFSPSFSFLEELNEYLENNEKEKIEFTFLRKIGIYERVLSFKLEIRSEQREQLKGFVALRI